MSGSGGFSGGKDVTTSCDKLKFETVLSSPKPITSSIQIGDQLEIELIEDDVYALYNGQIAGGISAREASRLKYCLGKGHTYKGTVISAKLGNIRLSVSAGII